MPLIPPYPSLQDWDLRFTKTRLVFCRRVVRCESWVNPQDRFLLQSVALTEDESVHIDAVSVSLSFLWFSHMEELNLDRLTNLRPLYTFSLPVERAGSQEDHRDVHSVRLFFHINNAGTTGRRRIHLLFLHLVFCCLLCSLVQSILRSL